MVVGHFDLLQVIRHIVVVVVLSHELSVLRMGCALPAKRNTTESKLSLYVIHMYINEECMGNWRAPLDVGHVQFVL